MDYEIHDEGHGSGFSEFSEFRPVFSKVLQKITDGKIKHLLGKNFLFPTNQYQNIYLFTPIPFLSNCGHYL